MLACHPGGQAHCSLPSKIPGVSDGGTVPMSDRDTVLLSERGTIPTMRDCPYV